MRVALFGSGSPQSVTAFRWLTPRVSAVVVPQSPAAQPLVHAAREANVDVLPFAPELAPRLRDRGIQLIAVASFPHMLRGALLEMPAVNLHMSLLPRHRGADPIFWTYYCADEESGVTLHWIDAGCDSGDVIFQERVPLPRAKPSRELYMELCEIGGKLLHDALDPIEADEAPRTPQDESRATHDPAPRAGTVRASFEGWTVGRAWHFLAGMSDQRSDLIVDANGVMHRHGRAIEMRDRSDHAPGTIVERTTTIEVHCRDGVVVMERPTLVRRIIRRLTGARRR